MCDLDRKTVSSFSVTFDWPQHLMLIIACRIQLEIRCTASHDLELFQIAPRVVCEL
jgi:hypothetical protein